MSAWSLLLCIAVLPSVEVTTLKGEHHVGALERLDADVVIKTPAGAMTISAAELLTLRFPSSVKSLAAAEATIEVRLTDGTRFRSSNFVSTGLETSSLHPQLGLLKLPLAAVQSS